MVEVANRKPLKLLVEERRRRILDLLASHHRVTVNELVAQFGVSAVTVRGDLDALAHLGQLVRSHGGGLVRSGPLHDLPIALKAALNHAEKVRIGRAAAALVRDGETVILDSGTTTVEIARELKHTSHTSLTVITNALNIATELAGQPAVQVIVMGGILRPTSFSLVGPQAEQALANLRADRLFLGVDGFEPDLGMTTPDLLEAQLNALMIRVAREITVVADASKFTRRSVSLIGTLDAVNRVITDDRVDRAVLDSLRARNVEVLVV
jgi:DeoR family transcriptional regulator of aga operon